MFVLEYAESEEGEGDDAGVVKQTFERIQLCGYIEVTRL